MCFWRNESPGIRHTDLWTYSLCAWTFIKGKQCQYRIFEEPGAVYSAPGGRFSQKSYAPGIGRQIDIRNSTTLRGMYTVSLCEAGHVDSALEWQVPLWKWCMRYLRVKRHQNFGISRPAPSQKINASTGSDLGGGNYLWLQKMRTAYLKGIIGWLGHRDTAAEEQVSFQ